MPTLLASHRAIQKNQLRQPIVNVSSHALGGMQLQSLRMAPTFRAGWLDGWLDGWLAAGWLAGCWLAGWMAGWLAAGWLAGWRLKLNCDI